MNHSPEFLAIVADAKSRVAEITVAAYIELEDAGTRSILIDVREESEWAAGHAAGATHIGKGIIERDIETCVPDKGATLVLYCGGGYRSALAADAIRRMGYSNVLSLAGGWRAWTEAGLPTVSQTSAK